MRDYENDVNAFKDATIDFFYDEYFKGEEGHDYTDEQITMSVEQADIDNCMDIMKDILYKHFDIKTNEQRKENMDEIKTPKEAIEYLVEAKDFITDVEDEIYDEKTNEETTGKLETAWVEIDQVVAYLQELNKEK